MLSHLDTPVRTPHFRRAPRAVPHPQPQPSSEPAPPWDRGLALLGVFSLTPLAIVLLIWLVASVDRWWFLAVAMAIHLVVTAVVLGLAFRLLDGDPST